MLFESILCAVLYVFFKCFDYQLGTLYAFRPIVVCPVVGAFLGDLNTGLVMGASIEALFMGSVSIGAYIPPDATSAGLLCTAYAILLGLDTEAAVGEVQLHRVVGVGEQRLDVLALGVRGRGQLPVVRRQQRGRIRRSGRRGRGGRIGGSRGLRIGRGGGGIRAGLVARGQGQRQGQGKREQECVLFHRNLRDVASADGRQGVLLLLADQNGWMRPAGFIRREGAQLPAGMNASSSIPSTIL